MFTGKYIAVGDMRREYDGDYVRIVIPVRIVSNGSDNVRRFEYPDDVGGFVQGETKDAVHDYVTGELFPSIRQDLKNLGFSEEKIARYLSKYSSKTWLDNIKR